MSEPETSKSALLKYFDQLEPEGQLLLVNLAKRLAPDPDLDELVPQNRAFPAFLNDGGRDLDKIIVRMADATAYLKAIHFAVQGFRQEHGLDIEDVDPIATLIDKAEQLIQQLNDRIRQIAGEFKRHKREQGTSA